MSDGSSRKRSSLNDNPPPLTPPEEPAPVPQEEWSYRNKRSKSLSSIGGVKFINEEDEEHLKETIEDIEASAAPPTIFEDTAEEPDLIDAAAVEAVAAATEEAATAASDAATEAANAASAAAEEAATAASDAATEAANATSAAADATAANADVAAADAATTAAEAAIVAADAATAAAEAAAADAAEEEPVVVFQEADRSRPSGGSAISEQNSFIINPKIESIDSDIGPLGMKRQSESFEIHTTEAEQNVRIFDDTPQPQPNPTERPRRSEAQPNVRTFDDTPQPQPNPTERPRRSEAQPNVRTFDDTPQPQPNPTERSRHSEAEQNVQLFDDTPQPQAQLNPTERPRRFSLEEDMRNHEITAEDIFNEVKIARIANQGEDQGPAQNLNSYIISKTFSSENVVVLLNLRRLNDGEWVLDKTIAQGLRPETYGGVVSIDQYDFREPSVVISKTPSLHNSLFAQMPADLTETLKRIEDNIMRVNEKVDHLQNSPPQCGLPPTKPISEVEVCEGGDLAGPTEPNLFDTFTGALNVFGSENPRGCNECREYDPDTSVAIGNWMRDMIGEIASLAFFPGATGIPQVVSTAIISQSKAILERAEAQTAALVEQSKALLEQVQERKAALLAQSKALLEQVQSTTTALKDKISNTLMSKSSKPEVEEEAEPEQVKPRVPEPTEDQKNMISMEEPEGNMEPEIPSEYQIDIESEMTLEELLKSLE